MNVLQRKTPAVFFRGGTSKAVFFRAEDVPEDADERNRMLRAVMGSPDPYGRQLDGLGGGISSLSKAMWVTRSTRNDADVDYTFAQIGIRDDVVDMSSNCGNMTSAVAPFAVEEGIFPVPDGPAMVRMFNTNTRKIVHAHFTVQDGRAVSTGDMEIPGVSGMGAPMRLDWMDPAGTAGRGVLPTGRLQETFSAPGFGEFPGSVVDAASVCVYVPAAAFGLTCAETPMAIDAMTEVMAALEHVRRDAAVRAGLAATPDAAAQASPRVAVIAPPVAYKTLAGTEIAPADYNIAVRVASMENIHRAVQVTGAMSISAALVIEGTLVNDMARGLDLTADLRIGNPSGVLATRADARKNADGSWNLVSTSAYRTFRRIMDGHVYHP
ncbi:MAG: PrpF family protein [Rhodospirillales bacterium CG15_BIG_FIL_POST_REV_8_21_14_020_66_15]|nr:MAG: PrpF family protein [Rhodospirillales bacterium CG15_BIG_FIL_POST_REV_8_21_14_020_66_15]